MPDLADHAYALACAVLGPGDAAAEVAAVALRRGGRGRAAVLGHARDETLRRAAEAPDVDFDGDAPDDLSALAAALAATRPPVERIAVDLDSRHGLDRGGFARALGLSPTAAGAKATAIAADWQASLDPAVLAHLGAGGCEGLAAIVAPGAVDLPLGDEAAPEPPPVTMRQLLDLGPSVADHAAGCVTCGDRLRSMVSVRTLLGQRGLEAAPASVRTAASAASRLRRATPPPPLEPVGPVRRRLRRALALVGVVIAVGLVGGGLAAGTRRRPAPRAVEALTRVPVAGSSLSVRPETVTGPTPPPVTLRNDAAGELRWEAVPDVPWLQVTPDSGELGHLAKVALRLVVVPSAPEGELRGSVRVTGDDGSVAVVRVSTVRERAPDVAADATGCAVTATVEDEGEVRSVELHRSEPIAGRGERSREITAAMQPTADGYTGQLPNAATAVTWWVTAVDARGNASRTADRTLAANSCP